MHRISMIVLVVLTGFLVIKGSEATMCDVQHPQTAVCRASYGKFKHFILILLRNSYPMLSS